MGHRSASLVLATVLLLRTAAPSAAVQLDSLDVPMDLALALIGGRGADSRILVGAIPAEAEPLINIGAEDRVVGSLVHPSGGTVVVEVPEPSSEALSRYVGHLERQGWTRAAMPQNDQGGFQTTSPFRQDTWCGDEYSIVGSTTEPDGGYLRIHYVRREAGRTLCDTGVLQGPRPRGSMGFRLPTLEPPPGAVVLGGGGGASDTSVDTEATIESELGIERIFTHFAEQLAAAGWIPDGRASADGIVVGRWRTQDADGAPAIGTLSIWSVPDPDSYVALLRMDRSERPR